MNLGGFSFLTFENYKVRWIFIGIGSLDRKMTSFRQSENIIAL